MISFSMLTGLAAKEVNVNAKVTVLKALGGNPKMPFLAMVAQGFPRLTTISTETLITTGEDDPHAAGIAHTVMIRDDQAIVGQIVGLQNVVGLHLDLAADHRRRARAAVPLPARVRRLDPLVEQDVEQLLAPGPGHRVGLSVQMHHGGGLIVRGRHGTIVSFQQLEHVIEMTIQ